MVSGEAGLLRPFVLGLVCVAAFLVVRLPLRLARLGLGSVNGTEAALVDRHQSWPRRTLHWDAGKWTVQENYLHPLLFVGMFLLPLVWSWRRIDGRLRPLILTLTPLLLLSNLPASAGWMYESRSYLPLVPLLATAVVQGARDRLSG